MRFLSTLLIFSNELKYFYLHFTVLIFKDFDIIGDFVFVGSILRPQVEKVALLVYPRRKEVNYNVMSCFALFSFSRGQSSSCLDFYCSISFCAE